MRGFSSFRIVASSLLGICALTLSVLVSVFVGTSAISTGDVAHVLLGQPEAREAARLVVWQVRLPRICGALLCGAALSVAGLLLQSVLNNDLASPGVMGINSGAGFFVLLAALLLPYGPAIRQLAAFTGALLIALLVQAIAQRAGGSRTSLILIGVAVSSLMSAGTNIIVTLYPDLVIDKLAFSLGGLEGVTTEQLSAAAPVVCIALTGAFLLAPGLDLLALGDETAFGLGLNVRSWRTLAVLSASALAAAAVSVCGLLGFVGLIIPNLIRAITPTQLRTSIVCCCVWGACFLVICDLVARVAFFPYEMPVGIILSLLGAPFFVGILIRRRRGWR